MPGGLLVLLIIGGLVGYAAGTFMRLRVSMPTAIAAGMFGALVGGFALRMLLSVFGALLGALLGAALVIALAQTLSRRR